MVVSPVVPHNLQPIDASTGLQVHQNVNDPMVLALLRLGTDIVFMVPFDDSGGPEMWTFDPNGTSLLHVDWELGFM